MSPKRASLPGKDALFGGGGEARSERAVPGAQEGGEPESARQSEERQEKGREAGQVAGVEVGAEEEEAASRHVQMCVWVDPEVAEEVDRARARLLMEHGVKVTKSEIVEAVLRPVLSDTESVLRLVRG